MNRLRYRAHSWMADRFDSVQYPAERVSPASAPSWRYPMFFGTRVTLTILGLLLIIVSGAVIATLGVLVWAVLR